MLHAFKLSLVNRPATRVRMVGSRMNLGHTTARTALRAPIRVPQRRCSPARHVRLVAYSLRVLPTIVLRASRASFNPSRAKTPASRVQWARPPHPRPLPSARIVTRAHTSLTSAPRSALPVLRASSNTRRDVQVVSTVLWVVSLALAPWSVRSARLAKCKTRRAKRLVGTVTLVVSRRTRALRTARHAHLQHTHRRLQRSSRARPVRLEACNPQTDLRVA